MKDFVTKKERINGGFSGVIYRWRVWVWAAVFPKKDIPAHLGSKLHIIF